MRPAAGVDLELALRAYASGLFPMDDPTAQDEPLPFYRAEPRAIFELTPEALATTRRRVRRSLARDPGWRFAADRGFEAVLRNCTDRGDGDAESIWITPRLAALYRALHAAGVARSWELWEGERLAAGVLGVVLGRAAMLESMFHAVSHAGNAVLFRTLELLAGDGFELCDIQLATPHTLRLGARQIAADEYERRLRRALA